MSTVINRWFPMPEPAAVKINTAKPGLTPAQLAANDSHLIAVLTAAVHRHREERKS